MKLTETMANRYICTLYGIQTVVLGTDSNRYIYWIYDDEEEEDFRVEDVFHHI